MNGLSPTDLGIVSPRLAALKRRAAAGRPQPLAPPPAPSIESGTVTELTRSVAACAQGGTVLDRPPLPPALPVNRRQLAPANAPAGTRSHERRWRDASIIIVERRRGPLYKYGSIAVCAALWAQMVWMLRL